MKSSFEPVVVCLVAFSSCLPFAIAALTSNDAGCSFGMMGYLPIPEGYCSAFPNTDIGLYDGLIPKGSMRFECPQNSTDTGKWYMYLNNDCSDEYPTITYATEYECYSGKNENCSIAQITTDCSDPNTRKNTYILAQDRECIYGYSGFVNNHYYKMKTNQTGWYIDQYYVINGDTCHSTNKSINSWIRKKSINYVGDNFCRLRYLLGDENNNNNNTSNSVLNTTNYLNFTWSVEENVTLNSSALFYDSGNNDNDDDNSSSNSIHETIVIMGIFLGISIFVIIVLTVVLVYVNRKRMMQGKEHSTSLLSY